MYNWYGLSDFRKGWLAGIIEGEGCFTKVGIEIEMTDKDVVQEVARIFNRTLRMRHHTYLETGHKPTYRTAIGGPEAVALAACLYPHMSLRRQLKIKKLLVDKVSLLDNQPLRDH